jgi:YVTN family beta-propeller protein
MRALRRAWFAVGCALVLAGCGEPYAEPGTLLFVTNERSGDLSVIDAAEGEVVATVPLGKRPRGIVLSPDRRALFIALSGSPIQGPPGSPRRDVGPADRSADGIGEVDVAERRLRRVIQAGTDPEQLAISPDGTHLYVANEDAGQLSIVSLPSGDVVARVPVGEEPEGVAVRPDGAEVYVASEETGEVAVIAASTHEVVARVPVGHRPRSIAFSPDGSRAYVTLENDGAIAEVDTGAHTRLRTIVLEGSGETPRPRPMGITTSADGARIFVTSGSFGSLFEWSVSNDNRRRALPVGQRPWGLGLNRSGRRAYTANGPSNDVSIVDVDTWRVLARVAAGTGPWGLAVLEPPE